MESGAGLASGVPNISNCSADLSPIRANREKVDITAQK